MVYVSDISPLLHDWQERLKNSGNDNSYNIALSECINDLENTLDKSVLHEGQSISFKDKQNGQWFKG